MNVASWPFPGLGESALEAERGDTIPELTVNPVEE